MYEIRLHGRGGQRLQEASRVLALSAVAEGKLVQLATSPRPNRVGAPAIMYLKISDRIDRSCAQRWLWDTSCFPEKFPPNIRDAPGGGAVSTGTSKALKAKGNYEAISVLMGGDGGLGDIGFGRLTGSLERNEDVLCICLDNEANNATGFQRSSSTPYMAWTPITEVGKASRGNPIPKKNLPLIVASSRNPLRHNRQSLQHP